MISSLLVDIRDVITLIFQAKYTCKYFTSLRFLRACSLPYISLLIYLVEIVFLKVESAHKLIINIICNNDSRVNVNYIYRFVDLTGAEMVLSVE
jgi:hypothetical protein